MSRRKRKGFFRRNLVAIITIAMAAGAALYYINDIEKSEIIENNQYKPSEPYHILENPDSSRYIANILIDEDISILKLSNIFYKNEAFWPYILIENTILNDNILALNKGTIVLIPKLPADILSMDIQEQGVRLKELSDSLQNDISEKRKEELDDNPFKEW